MPNSRSLRNGIIPLPDCQLPGLPPSNVQVAQSVFALLSSLPTIIPEPADRAALPVSVDRKTTLVPMSTLVLLIEVTVPATFKLPWIVTVPPICAPPASTNALLAVLEY